MFVPLFSCYSPYHLSNFNTQILKNPPLYGEQSDIEAPGDISGIARADMGTTASQPLPSTPVTPGGSTIDKLTRNTGKGSRGGKKAEKVVARGARGGGRGRGGGGRGGGKRGVRGAKHSQQRAGDEAEAEEEAQEQSQTIGSVLECSLWLLRMIRACQWSASVS